VLTIVVGGFFGDEGKGTIVAFLALKDRPQIAVRGGAVNAGHTVVLNGRSYKLRITPSAFVNKTTRLLIAPGALVRLDVLQREVVELDVKGRLFLDFNTGVIEDRHVEEERKDPHLSKSVGSTLQGVGAAAADRVLRKLKLARDFEELREMLTDVPLEVNEALDRGERVLLEGTQGTFLSLYHGTYPYVTSRDTTASAFASEAGVGPKRVDQVLVVFKSYVTRVGAGPLEGELSLEETVRRGWVEHGTVTGRPRRVAPFNLKLAKRAVMLNSATQAAITKLDIVFPQDKCIREWSKLSRKARAWIEGLEGELKVPITLLSTGEEVECAIDRRIDVGVEV